MSDVLSVVMEYSVSRDLLLDKKAVKLYTMKIYIFVKCFFAY